METSKGLLELLESCVVPLITFVVGLFFPQVRLANLVDALRPTHRNENIEKKG